MAVRISQDLRMTLEPTLELSVAERDERRRLFWSLFLLDRFICCSFHRPSAIKDADCHLGLPADDGLDMLSLPVTLKSLLDKRTRSRSLQPGIFGLSVGLSAVLGHTIDEMMNKEPGMEDEPWLPDSPYSSINRDLEFLRELASRHGSVLTALRQHPLDGTQGRDGERTAQMVLIYTLYHLNHCLLSHPLLLGSKIELLQPKVPLSWMKEAQARCFTHARSLTTLLINAKAAGYMPVPSFYSYCILVAGTILALHACSDEVVPHQESEGYLQSSLTYLGEVSELWENAHIMATALRSFIARSARYSDILLQDQPHIQSLGHEEFIILRSVIDYWAMMDPRDPFSSLNPNRDPSAISPEGSSGSSKPGDDTINPHTLFQHAGLSPMPSEHGESLIQWDWDGESTMDA
ncbi:hypothetical protein EYZ11_000013 [Aspergillus tanneri]|nr:hypothetical protein EYZ11_000013 [Aspergillus tanneri]